MNVHNTPFFVWFAGLVISALFMGPAVAAGKTPNTKPVANAGNDQVLGLGASVVLDGQKSLDADGVIKKFLWQQTKGVKVKLSGAKTSSASFVTPKQLTKNQTKSVLSFKLTVTDNRNKKASDTVTVSVFACEPPKQIQNGLCVLVCNAPQILENGFCVNPPLVCQVPKILKRGQCVDPVSCTLPQVLENGICVTPPPTCTLPETLQNGVCAVPSAPNQLNDSGIVHCSDTEHPRTHCGLHAYPGQDAEFGRDLLNKQDVDGKAGFSFTKIGSQGEVLDNSATEWSCIQDNVTGLIWENKSTNGDLHDVSNLFTHFGPNYDPQGQYGAGDDAQGLVNAVNAENWCGAHDWRLPTAQELQGIVDYGIAFPGPAIDERFFPNSKNTPFWTATPHSKKTEEAWAIYFDDGRIFEEYRHTKLAIRLVRTSTGAAQ